MNRTTGLVGALIALANPVIAQAPSTPETRTLALAVANAGGESDRIGTQVHSIGESLSNAILIPLGSDDPSKAAKVRAIVDRAVSPLTYRLLSAEVDYYSANFSAEELGQILAFTNGPTGRIEATKLPAMQIAIQKVLLLSPAETKPAVDAAQSAFDRAPPTTRNLIDRIMGAQDVAGRVREARALLAKMASSEFPQTGHQPPGAEPSTPTAADDEFAKMIIALERGFYATNFSADQLADVAAYLESKGGGAAIAKKPLLIHSTIQALRDELETTLSNVGSEVCAAVTCTADQRADVTKVISRFQSALSSLSETAS